jgi:hypothetical protein
MTGKLKRKKRSTLSKTRITERTARRGASPTRSEFPGECTDSRPPDIESRSSARDSTHTHRASILGSL